MIWLQAIYTYSCQKNCCCASIIKYLRTSGVIPCSFSLITLIIASSPFIEFCIYSSPMSWLDIWSHSSIWSRNRSTTFLDWCEMASSRGVLFHLLKNQIKLKDLWNYFRYRKKQIITIGFSLIAKTLLPVKGLWVDFC